MKSVTEICILYYIKNELKLKTQSMKSWNSKPDNVKLDKIYESKNK